MKHKTQTHYSLPKFALVCLSATLLLATNQTWAQSDTRFSLGAKLDFSTWGGDNPGGENFENESAMLGLEAKVQRGKWFGGLTLSGGTFKFSTLAPTRPSSPLPANSEPTTIKRGETDLVLGYRFWPRIALFLDIKNVVNEWNADGYKIEYTGLGVGIAGHHPLTPKWTLFGNFGFVPMNIEADGNNVGDARRSALNVGFLYRIKPRLNLSIGLQSQTQTNDYDNGDEQTHSIGALTFGVNLAL